MLKIVFFVNGSQAEVTGKDLETWPTLLLYLRKKLGLTGSKNGCGQGSCGACSVILSKFDHRTQKIRHVTVNGCITPLYYVHGCAVTTVEGISTSRDVLHPVQRSLVDHHGLQCGFCTPGMVISLCCLLRNNPRPTKTDVERAIEGNLCRCTGYRPIIESMNPFVSCPLGEKCCKNDTEKQEVDNLEMEVRTIDPSQDCIFPPQLKKWTFEETVVINHDDATWIVPSNLQQLKAFWVDNPTARFVAGATATGNLTEDGLPFISCHKVEELMRMSADDKGIDFGSAVTFTMMEDFLKKLKLEIKEMRQLPVLQAFLDCIQVLGTEQIRNVATIGGHIACRCDYLDMLPLLFLLEATVYLLDITGNTRVLTVEEYLSNQQMEELVLKVHIPFNYELEHIEFCKTPNRRPFDSDVISAAVVLGFNQEGEPRHFNACFSGLVPNCLRLDLLKNLPQSKRTWKDMTAKIFNHMLRERLCKEKVEVKDGLINLCEGIMQKFFEVVNKTSTDTDLPTQPDHCRSNIVFDGVPSDQSPVDPVWRPLPQTTAKDLVSGQAMFIDDMPCYQNELYLCLILSKRSRARLKKIDWSGARKFPDVVDCLDHTSVSGSNMWGVMTNDEELFASEEVIYWGQPVGAVIAESRKQAMRAAAEVKIEYEDIPPILTIEDAIKHESYIDAAIVKTRGDVISGFSRSDRVLEGVVCTGAQEHMYMETMGAIGVPKREQNEIEVFVSHQAPSFIQKAIATCLGIPFNKVIVRHRRTGGAFGGKETQPVKICVPVALAAQRNGRPVRCILSREEDMIITGKRHPSMCQYKVGLGNDGVIQALEVQMYLDGGCSRDVSLEVLGCTIDYVEGCFSIPNIKIEGRACKTNTASNTSFRGFGIPQAYVAMETIIDHVAHALNMNPKRIQEINFAKTGFVPFSNHPIQDETVLKAWEQCQKQAKYSKKEADVIAFNEKHKHKKRGLAMMAIRFQNGFGVPLLNQGNALLHVYLDGSVSLSHGGCELGQGLNMKLLQIASRALGIPLSKIYTTENSTHTVANANATVGSSTTDIIGAAVLDACSEIKNRLQPFKEKKRNASWEELIIDAYLNRVSLSLMGHGKPGSGGLFYYTYGAGCSMVEIDCLTGEHQVLSTDIVMDVGRSLNPGIDVGQIEGAFLQGYGMVAMEEWRMTSDGEVICTGPAFYTIPKVDNLPRDFNVTLLSDSPNKEAIVYSSKGIGEPPLLLAITVHKAIRAAVLSARNDKGFSDFVRLDTPVSSAMVLEACAGISK